MESMFGMETMGKGTAQIRMNRSFEQEILKTARTHDLVRKSQESHSAWYGPALTRLGDLLVASGLRLKSHYSIQQAYRAR
jgi:hypothetical protein